MSDLRGGASPEALTTQRNVKLRWTTAPSHSVDTFTYTSMDVEDTFTPPDLGIGNVATTYTYNADRQLTQVTRPDGQTITLNYELTGARLSSLTDPRGQTTFAYNPTTGQVASIASPGGVGISFTYDGSLLLGTTWSGPVAASVTRTYDTDFQVATESVNGGNSITFKYDPDSLFTQAGTLIRTRHPQYGVGRGPQLKMTYLSLWSIRLESGLPEVL